MKISAIKKLFLFFSGTDIATISQCPPDLVTRYAILGALPFIPAILGFCSAAYAISFVFHSKTYSFMIAGLWAFTIFTIDRCIIACNPPLSREKGQDTGRRKVNFWMPFSRVVLSIALGLVIAEPICLSIFQDVIHEELINGTRMAADSAAFPLEQKIDSSKKNIENARKLWHTAQDTATVEGDGTGGSKVAILGHKYWQKQHWADTLKRQFAAIKQGEEQNISNLEQQIDTLKRNVIKNKATSLFGQIHALNAVASKHGDLNVCIWFMRGFLVCLELIPLILKSALKRRSDAYVVIGHDNNETAIDFNRDAATNITLKQMRANVARKDVMLDELLAKKHMDTAARDFKYYFNMSEDTAKFYEKTRSKMEGILKNDQLRLAILGNLFTAYSEFMDKIKELYSNLNNTAPDEDQDHL